jgi:hypothetical protein
MSELITNGGFDADATWTKGTGWTISGGQALASTVGAAAFLSQPVSVVKGGAYRLSFDVANFASGSVRASFDSGDVGTTRSADGTYVETITLTAAATILRFAGPSAFTGRIDNVSVQGLTATIDEIGLALALRALQGSYVSPEAMARQVILDYLGGGSGAVWSSINETGLALATQVLVYGSLVSPEARVRQAVSAYTSQVSA